jgi:hypothetical protein
VIDCLDSWLYSRRHVTGCLYTVRYAISADGWNPTRDLACPMIVRKALHYWGGPSKLVVVSELMFLFCLTGRHMELTSRLGWLIDCSVPVMNTGSFRFPWRLLSFFQMTYALFHYIRWSSEVFCYFWLFFLHFVSRLYSVTGLRGLPVASLFSFPIHMGWFFFAIPWSLRLIIIFGFGTASSLFAYVALVGCDVLQICK